MGEHGTAMAELLRSRAARGWNRTVNQLQPAEVIAELEVRRANGRGRNGPAR